jgi:pentatricopeptide repeat protein
MVASPEIALESLAAVLGSFRQAVLSAVTEPRPGAAPQMKALARHGEWRAALKLFERMRERGAQQRASRRASGPAAAAAGRAPQGWVQRGAPGGAGALGRLGTDVAADEISYTLAALICERNQLWQQARYPPAAWAGEAGQGNAPRARPARLHTRPQSPPPGCDAASCASARRCVNRHAPACGLGRCSGIWLG